MSQSQRVSKLSRRAGRGAHPPPAPAPAADLPDLDTSDDFTPSLSFTRSRSSRVALSQSSCAAEPSSSQSQQLSGDISDALRAPSVSFCGVLDRGVQQPSSGIQQPSVDVTRPRRTRQATRASVRSSRTSRATRQSASTVSTGSPPPDTVSEGGTSGPPLTVDLSRFAWTASASSAASKSGQAPSATSVSTPKTADSTDDASPSAALPRAPLPSAPLPSAASPPVVAAAPAAAPAAGPAAAAAVADCPVCLQPLPSAAARAAHLKLCGERRGLSAAQLLAAVRLQRRQAGERAAAGLPATRTAPPPAGRRARTAQQGRRRGAAAAVAPSAAGDADLQMALAVSASLRDEEERSRRLAESQLLELGLGGEVQAARDSGAAVPAAPAPAPALALDTAGPPDGRSRGRGGRRKAAPTSVLLTQTKEERERRLCEKVAQLLAWEEEVPVEVSRLGQRKGSPQPAPLWEKAAQLHTSEGDYYVPELVGLVEPCTAPITSLLRDVADIPGRISLTQRVSGEDPGSGSEAEMELESEETAGATQAALLLLAADYDSQSSQLPADSGPQSSQLPAGSGPQSSQLPAGPQSSQLPPDSDSQSSQPPGDPNPAPAADTAEQTASAADGTALKTAGRDVAGSGAVSGVTATDSAQNRTARSRGEAADDGGGDGSPVDRSPPRGAKSSPVNTDADTGCGFVSESPSKAAEVSCSPPAVLELGEVEMTSRARMSPIPADDPSNVEKSPVTSPTRTRAEKGSVCPADPGSGMADCGDGPSSDQTGELSGPGRNPAERSRAPPVPPAAAGPAETASAGYRVTARSELLSPRPIPSTPDSSPGSPAALGSSPGSSPLFPSSPDVLLMADPRPGRRTPVSPVCSDGTACFTAETSDLGEALLDLLLTGGGPAVASLLCSDGTVAVHAAVLAVRCPPLYRAVTEAGGRLPLPEVSHRAAAALVRLLYLGETECAAGGAPLPQLLLLAERFGLQALVRHLRREHGVTEAAAGPARPPPSPSPLSPELFDLTASDGAEDMEQGSPGGDAAPGPGPASDCRQSPRRGSDSVVCTPAQTPERGEDEMDLGSPGGPTAIPSHSQAGETSRRADKTATEGDRTPLRDRRTPSPAGVTPSGAGDAPGPSPSTPRRGQKRPGATPRRLGSSDDICEVFSSLPKRRRTAPAAGTSPAGPAELPSSPASQRLRSESPAAREPRAASLGLQETRPGSADSDVQILDEVPVVFTQRVKSPRRSSGRMEGVKSPVKASEAMSGDRIQDSRSGTSPTKMPSQVGGSRQRSPVGDVSLLSSPSLSQTQPRRQPECGNDSFAESPLVSRRLEQVNNSREQPSTASPKHRKSRANEVDSPVSSQRLAGTPSDPVAGENPSPVSLRPYSPEVAVMSPPHSPELTSRVSPRSSSTPRRPVSPKLSPGDRPDSPSESPSPVPDATPSPPADPPSPPADPPSPPADPPSPPLAPPLADVWDGFEDGGYIELVEAPPPLTPPLPAAAGGSSPADTVAPPAGPRSSLDRSELWQDSSLLADFSTPTAVEPPGARQTDAGTLRVHAPSAGTSRARPKDAGTPGVEPEDAGTPGVRPGESGTPGGRLEDSGTPGVRLEESGTPDAGMPPPQRTPVNPYRVVLRDSNTPLPNYVLMLTPELKRELARIGVKPIARRKAVALLSHIYNETHPPASTAGGSSVAPQTASSASTAASRDASSASGSGSSRSVSSTNTSAAFGSLPSWISPLGSSSAARPAPPGSSSAARPAPPGGSSVGQSAPAGSRPDSDEEERFARPREPAPAAAREPRSRSPDSESSGSEGAAARLEEVFGRLGRRLDQQEEEEEEKITPSQAASAATLPEVLRSYITSRPELHHQVLTYEPVWLESLHRDLRQTGVKLSLAQLMDFLDEQCITFRTENSGRRRKSPKKKKSPKKNSPKKRGPSQKKKSPRKKAD